MPRFERDAYRGTRAAAPSFHHRRRKRRFLSGQKSAPADRTPVRCSATLNGGDPAIPTPDGHFPFPSGATRTRYTRGETRPTARTDFPPRWEANERARSMLFLSCIKEKRRSAGNRNRSGSARECTPDWTTTLVANQRTPRTRSVSLGAVIASSRRDVAWTSSFCRRHPLRDPEDSRPRDSGSRLRGST